MVEIKGGREAFPFVAGQFGKPMVQSLEGC
jgi:hypothetical protein